MRRTDPRLVVLLSGFVVACGSPGDGEDGGTSGSSSTSETGEPPALDLPTSGDAPSATVEEFAGSSSAFCIREASDAVACWGYAKDMEFTDEHGVNLYVPTVVSGLAGARGLSFSESHGCAVFDSEVKCWGLSGESGTVDPGSVSTVGQPRSVEGLPGLTWVQTGSSVHASCALSEEGEIWCWGSNKKAGLGAGLEISEDRTGPVRVLGDTEYVALSISTTGTACALDVGQRLWCWGSVPEWEGGGDGEPRLVPAPVEPLPDERFVQVRAQVGFVFAISTDGQLWAWGWNYDGILGTGTGEDHPVPTIVSPEQKWVDVASSGHLSCGIGEDQRAWCWGRYGVENDDPDFGIAGPGYGRTGAVASAVPVPGPAGSWRDLTCARRTTHTDACCGLTADGSFWCWGDDTFNQMANGSERLEETTPRRLFSSG